jgi:heavy metal translocating P-type ATPase
MYNITSQIFCALCQIELPRYPIMDGENGFCCSGCHAVYHILASKQRLDNYQETPVFQQALKAGLISNPALLEQIRQQKSQTTFQELEKLHLEILDMWCPSCAEIIRLILLQQKGISNCVVDYSTDLASIEFAPRLISKEKICEIIASLGYDPHSLETAHRKKVSLGLYLRLGIASFCALNAMMFSYPLYATYFDPQAHEDGHIFAWLTFLSSLPVVTYCMWPILKRFCSSLMHGLLGMEALVVVGVSAAFGLSLFELWQGGNQVYFDSMSVIIAFVLLGKMIETKAKFSVKESLFRLSRSLPRRGRKLFADGSINYVPIKEILPGDILVAYAGEKIILDGEVVEGEGTCDESLMTGESLPIAKQKGSKLVGGAILQHGALTFKVLCGLGESALQMIIRTVEQDLGHKSAYVRAADKIVQWFVPLVFILALIAGFSGWYFDGEFAIGRMLAVLLIACPCAIGIAAPLTESQILHQLAVHGVIVRNKGCLALLPRLTTFIFDKTGTVTEGNFRLLDGLQGLTQDELGLLKTLARPSNHLIARAIFNAIEAPPIDLEHVEEYPGKGMKGFNLNAIFLLGSAQFFQENGLEVEEQPWDGLGSTVYFSPDGIKVHRLLLGDQVRAEVPEVIKKLKAKTILLSGDSHDSVAKVADLCGFDAFFSKVTPLQKREFVENLRNQGETVCMVGDGINDAPALTAAHVGVSVVAATDISIQVSDLLLTTEQLNVLPHMQEIAAKGQRKLKQNMFWAFFYNCIGIGLAMAGLLTPLFAAFAMTISSLFVLLNQPRNTKK